MITSTKTYASVRDITARAVRKAIVKGHSLPGVISAQKLGRDYALTIDTHTLAKYLGITEKKVVNLFGSTA